MGRELPYYQMSKIRFSAYTSNEIIKLSVLEVTNPETVDVLGNPSKGGLHDPALGPNENNEPCGTCGLKSLSCPGHIGHISLPLPVYNPFFFKTLYQLLRGSCFKCHCLMAPEAAGHLLLAQLQALDHGLVGLAQYLRQIAADNEDVKNQESIILIKRLTDVLEDALKEIDVEEAKKSAHVKNVVECRQKIIRSFIKEYLMGKIRECPKCKMTGQRLEMFNNRKFVFVSKVSNYSLPAKYVKKPSSKLTENEISEIIDELGLIEQEVDEPQPKDKDSENSESYLSPTEAQKHLRLLWENEGTLLQRLYGSVCSISDSSDSHGDIFFLNVVPVPASRFRPLSFLNGLTTESPQTSNLKQVLKYSMVLRTLLHCMKKKVIDLKAENISEHIKLLIDRLIGKSMTEKFNNAWLQLQTVVNCVLDSDLDKLNKATQPGVKQILEKKEGLFRKNMMGKRVNYAARSVISPDPNIAVNEIGIPHVFAIKLTYPQPVTPWNIKELTAMVINGPDIYPGATLLKTEDGTSIKLSQDIKQRAAVAKQLLTPIDTLSKDNQIKIVYRHLKNGDALLLNRQPTLHRPSIMAHKARILPGEKTLRLHYANCKSYNADFDGDEMNAHFPQSEHARAEAYTLALVDNHYLVPKDGTPLSGLIQDHVISGSLMSIRGRFFNKNDYQELVFSALSFKKSKIKTLPPAIQKPRKLWSGKQVISTVIINVIPEEKSLINLIGKSKTSPKNWNVEAPNDWVAGGSVLTGNSMGESEVIIRSGELVCGILDKAHYGSSQYGLVHCCYELYGGGISTLLLSAFSRLFTYFLKFRGFTLGVEDILVLSKANKKRRKLMKASTKVGDEFAAKALNLSQDVDKKTLYKKLQEVHFHKNDFLSKQLDQVMKETTDDFNNKINTVCLPKGLLKKFPHNNLQLMVESGAKGSTVNTMQISGLLGQIELEGRRPPITMSGRSLPSFLPYDTSPRSRGFIAGRFLSGIRPQEYFFHCMAGREGLVDTAVKTSRSGYLQRCLIKHLEGIVVNYDMTVRDCDGSVIQFYYGDDGLDITKTQFLKPSQMPFLCDNYKAVADIQQINAVKSITKTKRISKLKKKIHKFDKNSKIKITSPSSGFLHYSRENAHMNDVELENENFKNGRSHSVEVMCERWRNLDEETKLSYQKINERQPDTLISQYRPDRNFGSVTEFIDDMIDNYLGKAGHTLKIDSNDFKDMCYMKTMRSLCEPGEAVGILAAQSVGEPSTQMTLNTFHFAGRGEMNVTLGIPRLVEILMVASASIATPSMTAPVLSQAEKHVDKLRLKMNKVNLNQLLETISISDMSHIKSKMLLSASSRRGSSKLKDDVSPPEVPQDTKDGNSSEEEDPGDGDNTATRQKLRHDQEQEYDESDHEDNASDNGSDEEVQKESMNSDDRNFEAMKKSKRELELEDTKEQRITDVLVIHSSIVGYNFDTKKEEWCEVTLRMELGSSKLDIHTIVEEEAKRAVVHEIPNINKAILSPREEPNYRLTIDGINIVEAFKYGHILNLNKLYSNDIHAMAKSFGIEAAGKVIVKEVTDVFAVYGIEVDRRHLSLIADYMTFEGSYKPFNRIGMESSASPIQQMSFETTLQFLKSAALFGYEDQLQSPSSRIVTGMIVNGGTGSFDLLQKPYSALSNSFSSSNSNKHISMSKVKK
ncbi:DNA-directed RNA polymerase I subunit RPA1 [Nymphon striatum]|nr:DNA-directed RNA polymerase I subunit RPA1 [Nymphon striatum]